MGLETATWISDLVATNPVSGDFRSEGDDHLRMIKAVLKTTLPNATKAFRLPSSGAAKTTNYTILSTDLFMFLQGSGSAGAVTFTPPALVAGDAGWFCFIQATNVTNTVKIGGTVNGVTDFVFSLINQATVLYWTGTAWFATTDRNFDINPLTALTAPALDDKLPIYDTSAAGNRAITPPDLLKVLNLLTTDATPDKAADFLMTYDTSASVVKKATPNSLAKPPEINVQIFTTGTGLTYTTPTSAVTGGLPAYLRVRMVGGGGGGAGAGGGAAAGGNGTNSVFGSWTAVLGNGGSGTTGGAGGTGGTNSTGTVVRRTNGQSGNGDGSSGPGGQGGASQFGGGGTGWSGGTHVGAAVVPNTGAGGGGANSAGSQSAGGGAGEFVEFVITAPAASYTYTVGAAGAAGAGAQTGAAGAAGRLEVEAYW